jgi:hypothetical protein
VGSGAHDHIEGQSAVVVQFTTFGSQCDVGSGVQPQLGGVPVGTGVGAPVGTGAGAVEAPPALPLLELLEPLVPTPAVPELGTPVPPLPEHEHS